MSWQTLFKYPQATGEGTLPFRFENFGTFAGPQFESLNYNYDAASEEGSWHTMVPGDFSFKNDDLGAYLYNNEFNYVGFHCDSVSTAMMTLEASYGNIPTFNVFATNTNVNGNISATGNINVAGNITVAGSINHTGGYILSGVGDLATSINLKANKADVKSFDIPHPNKDGWRLRHVCVEGPEDGPIYIRGKLNGNNDIVLPEYWKGLIDEDSITVHLTPFGTQQDLFVDQIKWGKTVIVKSGSGGPIKCYYQVWANRLADEKLHVEYKGESPADYPGDNTRFSIAGYDYDKRVD